MGLAKEAGDVFEAGEGGRGGLGGQIPNAPYGLPIKCLLNFFIFIFQKFVDKIPAEAFFMYQQ